MSWNIESEMLSSPICSRVMLRDAATREGGAALSQAVLSTVAMFPTFQIRRTCHQLEQRISVEKYCRGHWMYLSHTNGETRTAG